MAIVAKEMKAMTPGHHRGIISEAREAENDFGKGTKKRVVEIDIQEAEDVLPVSISFAASLNGLSGLSQFIRQLGLPHPKDGVAWNPQELEGIEIEFDTTNNERGFATVTKSSIRRAKQSQ